jgi:hypothetical protein
MVSQANRSSIPKSECAVTMRAYARSKETQMKERTWGVTARRWAWTMVMGANPRVAQVSHKRNCPSLFLLFSIAAVFFCGAQQLADCEVARLQSLYTL